MMIDYDKLKTLRSRIEQGIECLDNDKWSISHSMDLCRSFMKVALLISDELIAESGVEELTQPEPKYKVGEKIVVFGWDDEIHEEIISSAEYIHNEGFEPYWYINGWIEDTYHRIYPTKSELIEAQIKYWSDMREKEQ